jgi:sulfoxide reductase heme-binding subunit YedZ
MTVAVAAGAQWYLGRGTGVTALVLFTLSVVLGVMTRSGRSAGSLPRFGVADLHRTAALTGTALVAVHVTTLLLDPYAQLRFVDLVFPFLAAYRPLYLGLGTLALDLLIAVVVTSLLRYRVGPRIFHGVHWATYVLWPFAFLHSLGTGTDAGTAWFRAIAAVCAIAFAVSVTWRLTGGFGGRGHRRVPRTVR